MDKLPKEPLFEIVSCLNTNDLIPFLQINKYINQLFKLPETWNQLIYIKYPNLTNVLTKESYIKWNDNITELLKLKQIAAEWIRFTNMAAALVKHNFTYVDDHSHNDQTLTFINICYYVNLDKSIVNPSESYNNYVRPIAWIFPGNYKSFQCKNQLYLYSSSDKLHLTTSSIGTDLYPADQLQLSKGRKTLQSGYILGDQLNFSLPVEIFCHMLTSETNPINLI